MNENYHESGVYVIRNVITGKRYVGSTTSSFKTRWAIHRHHLDNGQHHSHHLQASWNRYGEKAFTFKIIQHCLPRKCLEREQFWMDYYKVTDRRCGYNTAPQAGNCLGSKRTPEQKKRMSESVRNRGPEWREKMKTANLGKGKANLGRECSQEKRDKISAKLTGRTGTGRNVKGHKKSAAMKETLRCCL